MTLPHTPDYLAPVVKQAFEKLSHDMPPRDGAIIIAILDSFGVMEG